MSLQTKKYVYGLPFFIPLVVLTIYFILTGQWEILALAPFAGLAGIGIAAIRLRYNLFWE